MTTVDIPRANGNALAALTSADDNLARLAQWVEAARNAHQLVAPLVGTAFVPAAYRPDIQRGDTAEQIAEKRAAAVANATAAVLYGLSLGIDPLMSLQQIYLVHGRPGLYAKMMVALVQGHGHEVWTEDLTDTRAVVCGRRKGSQHPERVTITMDQARKAGWTSNKKYAETPQDMLWARAAGRVCDRIASDVIKGIGTVEQIEDETLVATAETGPAVRTVVPRKRAAAAAIGAVEEPPLDEPETPAVPAEPDPVDIGDAPLAMTPEQSTDLHGLLRELGSNTKAKAPPILSGIIGRDVADSKELTQDEAATVILELERRVAAGQVVAEAEQPELVP